MDDWYRKYLNLMMWKNHMISLANIFPVLGRTGGLEKKFETLIPIYQMERVGLVVFISWTTWMQGTNAVGEDSIDVYPEIQFITLREGGNHILMGNLICGKHLYIWELLNSVCLALWPVGIFCLKCALLVHLFAMPVGLKDSVLLVK